MSSSKFDPFLPFLFSLRKKNDHRPSRKTKNLKWAVESRAKNQRSAVQLLHLFMEYEEQWKTKNWAGAAQALLSVSFSLWRAAFLADKTAKRSAVFSHARNFLEKVIEDNAISYTQDRNCKDWTFNYYTTNAKQALLTLHEHWHTELPAWEKRKRTPTERWQYCQELLDQAVANFAVLAQGTRAKKTLGKQRKDVRLAAKVRKQKSRAYTLASRIAAEEVAGDTLPTGDPS